MRVLAAGTLMVDVMAVELPSLAEPAEVVYTSVDTHIGGHPIDVAIDLVRLGRPPDSVALVGAIGSGPFASLVRDAIAGSGIHAYLQEVDGEDAGRNLVLEVSGEDRRFHLDPGANSHLTTAHVVAALEAWRPDVFTVRPGYTGIDLALPTILAPLNDTVVLLDIMEPHPDRPIGYLEAALPHADIVHCNAREALQAARAATLPQAVAGFLAAGVRLVLVTDGAAGARAFTDSWEVVQPGFAVDAVDGTGCGDAFCAGLIASLDEGSVSVDGLEPGRLTELLLAAQSVGAAAATAVGCTTGVTAATVSTLVAEQGDHVRKATRVRKGATT